MSEEANMGVPKEIREVERPTNTIVCDNGKDTPFRYAVRERAASGKYVRGNFRCQRMARSSVIS